MSTTIRLVASGSKLKSADLDLLEAELGSRLPDDYRGFLLQQNGGIPDPRVRFKRDGGTETVGLFFQLGSDINDGGVRRGLFELREIGVDGYLPIAYATNDTDICIAFKEDAGAVYITEYEYKTVFQSDRARVSAAMMKVSNSFTEFLASLSEIDEPYCRIENLGEHGRAADLAQYLAEGNFINSLGKNGLSIACEAIKFDNVSMLQACIDREASLSQTIYLAVINQRTDLIEMLLKAGADINEPNEFGTKPLSFVGGTALPGEEGAKNRELRDLLVQLGATK